MLTKFFWKSTSFGKAIENWVHNAPVLQHVAHLAKQEVALSSQHKHICVVQGEVWRHLQAGRAQCCHVSQGRVMQFMYVHAFTCM